MESETHPAKHCGRQLKARLRKQAKQQCNRLCKWQTAGHAIAQLALQHSLVMRQGHISAAASSPEYCLQKASSTWRNSRSLFTPCSPQNTNPLNSCLPIGHSLPGHLGVFGGVVGGNNGKTAASGEISSLFTEIPLGDTLSPARGETKANQGNVVAGG